MNSIKKTLHSSTVKEDWKLKNKTKKKRKLTLFFSLTTKCSPRWMLALKGTGNNRTPQHILCQPASWDPVMFPMAYWWQEWVWARSERDQANELWRTETWLDVTYLLSNLSGQSWGRTGGVHFCKQHKPPFPLKNSCTASVPVLRHTPSPCPSWNINMAFWIRVEENKSPYSSGLSIESNKSFTVYNKPLVLML